MYGGERFGGFRLRAIRKPIILLMVSIILSKNTIGATICPHICVCQNVNDAEMGYILRIVCSKGKMETIPVESFDRFAQVIEISAPKDRPNKLTVGPIFLRPKLFQNLRKLHIINSNVPSIGKNSFWGLKYLTVLNLSYNSLTDIRADDFRGLISLTELNLDHNYIHNMTSETFKHLTALKTLILSHNQISELVPRLFRTLQSLTHLDLSDNPIPFLDPDVFMDIMDLKIFKCRRCLVTRVNLYVYHLINRLEELDLGENQIKFLALDEFTYLKKLKTLRLDGNELSVIVNNMFVENYELQILSLSHNRIVLLAPDALVHLNSLVDLDISYNRIESFQLQTFSSVMRSLKRINLSGNNLPPHEIAYLLKILPNINTVGLASLSFDELPPNFFKYNIRLIELDLSWNKFTKFPFQLLAKPKLLQRLDLSRNRIEGLEDEDLVRLEAIGHVDLSGNPWRCNKCYVGTMFVWMATTVLNGTIRHLTCNTPLRLRGVPFSALTLKDLDSCFTGSEVQMRVLAGLLLISFALFTAIAVAMCRTRRRAANYYTNEDKRSEREHEHPEELLNCTDHGTVATIHSPTAWYLKPANNEPMNRQGNSGTM